MSDSTLPTKQQVRDWMEQRRVGRQPLPDIKQIRRELGWCWNLPKNAANGR